VGCSGLLLGRSLAGQHHDEAGDFFQLCRKSLQMYPAWIKQLEQEVAADILFSKEGLLFLASSADEFAILERRCEWQTKSGLKAEIVSVEHIKQMEPLVTTSTAGGLFLQDEISVSPRRLVDALRESCLRRGVEIRTGVFVKDIAELDAGAVIIASGVWSSEIDGLNPPLPLRPRKGQILSLRMPPASFRRIIRWKHSYFVPRSDDSLVVGATNEDVGFDRSLTPAGIGRLLSDAQQISLHTANWPIEEMWTGLRPATPDELPVIGLSNTPDVYYAGGHYRNGVLLAPITAALIEDLLLKRPPRVPIDSYRPGRFTEKHV